jgi:ABC-type polysaccharide/polyol phosphate export permease
MFIGILLSSTLIIIEKNSKSFFRNFTTPTNTAFFISTTYLTALITIILQVAVILILASIFLQGSILNNFLLIIPLLLLSITLFILLGMAIGYLFNTQEAVTMSSISIGSVFLFLSNLILPLETLPNVVQKIASFNPYVLTSETIRRASLFTATFQDLQMQFLILFGYIVVILVLIIFIQKLDKRRFLAHLPHIKHKGIIALPEDQYLRLEKTKIVIKSEEDLLNALRKMDDRAYRLHANKRNNEFADWVRSTLKEKLLAFKIRNASREKTIKILEKHYKKVQKEIEKVKIILGDDLVR